MNSSIQDARRAQLDEDVGALLSSRSGRRLFYVITHELGRVHRSSFDGTTDETIAKLNDGRRALALELYGVAVRKHPDLHALMMREQEAEIAALRDRERAEALESTPARERKTQ